MTSRDAADADTPSTGRMGPRGASSARLRFHLPLDAARLLRARHRIRDYLHEHEIDPLAINDVVLALQEAMTNAVRHSGASEDLTVALSFAGPDLVTEVVDHGRGFDTARFDSHACPDLESTGGRGLFLIAQLMDELELKVDDGLEVRAIKRGVLEADPALGSGPASRAVPSAQAHRDARERELLEEIDEGFFALDWEYRYLRVNSAWERLYGCERETVLGLNIWEAFPHLPLDAAVAVLRGAMELGRPSILEYLSPALGRWLELRAYPSGSGVVAYVRDIDERKRKELERDALVVALEASEEKYRALIETAAEGVVMNRLNGEFLFVNQRMAEMLGYPVEEILGKSGMDFAFPDALPEILGALNELADGQKIAHEFKFRRKDGSALWTSYNASPVFDENGEHVANMALHTDITERKAAEGERSRLTIAVQQERDTLAALISSITDEVWFADANGNIVLVNPAVRREFGALGVEQTVEVAARLEIYGPDGTPRPPVEAPLLRALRGDTIRDEEETILVPTRGELRDRLVSAAPVLNQAGDIIGAVTVVRDVTERKQAERALDEMRFILAEGQRIAHVGTFEYTAETQTTVWSDEECRIYGLAPGTPSPSYQTMLEQFVPADDAALLDATFRKAMETGSVYELEHRILLPDGTIRVVLDRAHPYFDRAGRLLRYVGATLDVTERKRAEEESRQALAQQEQQAKRLRMLSEVAKTASSALEERELAQRLVATIGTLLEASHVSIVSPAADGQLHMVAARRHPEAPMEEATSTNLPGDRLLARAHRSGQRILVEDREAQGARQSSKARAAAVGIGSSAALPLLIQGESVGVLGLTWPLPRRFSVEDVSMLDSVAAEVAVGLDNARRYAAQQRIATMLQENLVHALPEVEGLEVAAVSQPASQADLVGGDFHDVFTVDDQVVVIVGDVMGKGIKAAGLTETVRSAARALALVSPSPHYILTQLSRLLIKEEREEFVSAIVLTLDPANGRCVLASAGHPPPAVLSAAGARFAEPRYGVLLGALDATYTATQFELASGDALVLYTDGLTEARRDGELFGEERLLASLEAAPSAAPGALTEYLRDAVLTWAGELKDDLEILVLRRSEQHSRGAGAVARD